MQGRNLTFDIMRGVAILCLVVAHCEPPGFIFQLRNFDVPLLILVSAMACARMSSDKVLPAFDFIKKRFLKLVVSTWIFLTFFFLIFFILPSPSQNLYPFTWQEVLGTYTFHSGIGYVWIIKVFMFLAVITPFLVLHKNKAPTDLVYFLFLGVAFLFYELVFEIVSNYVTKAEMESSFWWVYAKSTIFTFIPYGILYAYGFKLEGFKNSTLCVISALSFTVFFICASYLFYEHGKLVQTQEYKYPPQLYYFSYAFGCIHAIYLVLRNVNFPAFFNWAMSYLSKHSFCIYLWHIMFLFVWKFYVGFLGFPGEWLVKSAIILVLSAILAGVQKRIIGMLSSMRLVGYEAHNQKSVFFEKVIKP